MSASQDNQSLPPSQDDLFALALALRAKEIELYKANPQLPAPVLLSLRGVGPVKIRWPSKF